MLCMQHTFLTLLDTEESALVLHIDPSRHTYWYNTAAVAILCIDLSVTPSPTSERCYPSKTLGLQTLCQFTLGHERQLGPKHTRPLHLQMLDSVLWQGGHSIKAGVKGYEWHTYTHYLNKSAITEHNTNLGHFILLQGTRILSKRADAWTRSGNSGNWASWTWKVASPCAGQRSLLDIAQRNSSRLLWRTAHDLSFLSSVALERVHCSLPFMALKMFFVRLLPMPCTMGLCYSFLVTHKTAVYYTWTWSGCPFQGGWLLLAGVGIFCSLITHFFSLYCATSSHGSLWLPVWRFFFSAM